MIESALRSRLATFSGLTALVGTRIYPLIMPQDAAFPAVTYQKISGPRVHAKEGPLGEAYPRFQVSVWAKEFGDSRRVSEQVRLALDGWRGTVAGVTVRDSALANETDLYESDTATYHTALDFIIWHIE